MVGKGPCYYCNYQNGLGVAGIDYGLECELWSEPPGPSVQSERTYAAGAPPPTPTVASGPMQPKTPPPLHLAKQPPPLPPPPPAHVQSERRRISGTEGSEEAWASKRRRLDAYIMLQR